MSERHFKTDQEAFWAGQFGTDYITRNQGDEMVASNLALFADALRATGPLESCIEFGSNIGMNLRALSYLLPELKCNAVEINEDAAAQVGQLIGTDNVYNRSIIEFQADGSWDLVLIKGVLIHINPDALSTVYDNLVRACGRYLLVAEYYNSVPVALPYRGHDERLYKRDFAGEIMDRHPSMRLVDYGFTYRRDPKYTHDDLNWFLMEKV